MFLNQHFSKCAGECEIFCKTNFHDEGLGCFHTSIKQILFCKISLIYLFIYLFMERWVEIAAIFWFIP